MADKTLEKTIPFITGPGRIKVSVVEYTKTHRVTSLAASKLYHQKKIEDINRELEMLLKEDVDNIDY